MSFYSRILTTVPSNQVWAVKPNGTHTVLSNNGIATGVWTSGVTAILLGVGTFTQRTVAAATDLLDLTGVGITNGVHIIGSGIGQTIIVAPTGQDQNAGGAYWKPGNYSIVQDIEGHLPLGSMIGRSWYLPGDGNFGGTYAQVAFTDAAFVRCKWVATGVDIFNIVTQEPPTDGPCSLLVLNNICISAQDNTNCDQSDSSFTLVGGTFTSAATGTWSRALGISAGTLNVFNGALIANGAAGQAAWGVQNSDAIENPTMNLYGCTITVTAGSGGTAQALVNQSATLKADAFTLAHLTPNVTSGTITPAAPAAPPTIYDISTIIYGHAGSDTTGDGTLARPFLTFARAMQFMDPGDTLVGLSLSPVQAAVDGTAMLVSNVPYFQTWTETNSAAAALASIFTGEVGWSVVKVSIVGGAATITTRDKHTIQVGDVVTFAGASMKEIGIYGGFSTIASVTSNTLVTGPLGLPDGEYAPEAAFVFRGERPFAVICESDQSLNSTSIGTGGASIYNGSIEILLEQDVNPDYANDPVNALNQARSEFGQFIQSLMTTQGTGDLMCLNKIEPVSGPEFTSDAEQDDNTNRFERWRALVRVTWGLEG